MLNLTDDQVTSLSKVGEERHLQRTLHIFRSTVGNEVPYSDEWVLERLRTLYTWSQDLLTPDAQDSTRIMILALLAWLVNPALWAGLRSQLEAFNYETSLILDMAEVVILQEVRL